MFNQYPYINENDLNLDYILASIKKLKEIMDEFIAINSVTFADPIIWNITKQYPKNTIVLDPTGNAYLSKNIVPAGAQLNNSDYWLEIFNFTDYTRTANQNLTVNVETNTTRATDEYNVDDWLIWNDVLYKVTTAIAIDDALIVAPAADANLEHFTVEDFIKAFITYATGLINQYKNDIDASELAYQSAMQAEVNRILAGATVDSEVIDARLGANGTNYPTLGTAIRSQFLAACVNQPALANNTDLNDIYLNGWYRVSTQTVLVNSPDGNIGRRIVFVYSADNAQPTSARFMIYINTGSVPCFAFRSYTGSVWNPWRLLPTSDTVNELMAYIRRVTYGDFTDMLDAGNYWNASGVKTSSENGSCTPPIYVPDGWGLLVSAGMGNSGCSICEVSENDEFIAAITTATDVNYLHISDGDKYYSVSVFSTVDSDVIPSIQIVEPERIEKVKYNRINYLVDFGCNAGHFDAVGIYSTSSSYTIWKTSKIRVKAGDTISCMAASGSAGRVINMIYDDNTTDYVLGASGSALRRYVLTASKDGWAYISSYSLDGPYFVCTSIADGEHNKFTSRIFKKVVCCGDSYTSGWISDNGTGIRNNPSFSFAHYMSMMTGNEWVDCGASGTSSITWQNNINGYDAVVSAGRAQAYIISLGINDPISDLGTPADIGTSAQTYYGGISQIVAKLALINPDAMIFINTNPDVGEWSGTAQKNEALKIIVDTMRANYNVFLIDLAAYSNYYKTPMIMNDQLDGHFTALGYEQFAELYNSIFSEYINNHYNDFQRVAFIPFDITLPDDEIDVLVSDGANITNSTTSVTVKGKYAEINNKVYFHCVMYINESISGGVNQVITNMPAPSNMDEIIFFDKINGTIRQKPSLRYPTNRWRLSGDFALGDVLSFSGYYDI